MASVPISEHPLETELTALERDLDSTPTSEWHGRSWHKLVEMQWAAGSLGQDHPKKQNLLDRCTTLERRLLRSLEDIPVRAPEAQKNPRKFSRKSSWTFSFVLSKVVSIGIYWGSSTMKSSLLTLKKDFDQRNQGQLYNMVCQLSPLLLR